LGSNAGLSSRERKICHPQRGSRSVSSEKMGGGGKGGKSYGEKRTNDVNGIHTRKKWGAEGFVLPEERGGRQVMGGRSVKKGLKDSPCQITQRQGKGSPIVEARP